MHTGRPGTGRVFVSGQFRPVCITRAEKANDRTALYMAAKNWHQKVVKVLLDSKAEKDVKEVDDWLLAGGAEKEAKDNQGWTALHAAVEN
jgi:ankyrin repeat protein